MDISEIRFESGRSILYRKLRHGRYRRRVQTNSAPLEAVFNILAPVLEIRNLS
jgi:hypothetical protein